MRFATIVGTSTEYYLRLYFPQRYKEFKKFNVLSLDEGVKKLKNYELEAVMFDAPMVEYKAATDPECKLIAAGSNFWSDTYGLAFPQGSSLTSKISDLIVKYEATGVLSTWEKKWLSGKAECHSPLMSRYRLSVTHARGVFILILVGVTVALIVLAFEWIVYKWVVPVLRRHKREGRWRYIMFISQRLNSALQNAPPKPFARTGSDPSIALTVAASVANYRQLQLQQANQIHSDAASLLGGQSEPLIRRSLTVDTTVGGGGGGVMSRSGSRQSPTPPPITIHHTSYESSQRTGARLGSSGGDGADYIALVPGSGIQLTSPTASLAHKKHPPAPSSAMGSPTSTFYTPTPVSDRKSDIVITEFNQFLPNEKQRADPYHQQPIVASQQKTVSVTTTANGTVRTGLAAAKALQTPPSSTRRHQQETPELHPIQNHPPVTLVSSTPSGRRIQQTLPPRVPTRGDSALSRAGGGGKLQHQLTPPPPVGRAGSVSDDENASRDASSSEINL